MTEAFLKIVNMSISASWIVLAVLLLRLLLKKAPKWITVLLWGVVALRLVLPFSIESVLSLIPSAETVNPSVLISEAEINTGFDAVDNVVNPVIREAVTTIGPEKGVNTFKLSMKIFSRIWLIGIAILSVYTFISYFRVRKKVATAVLLRDNIFQSEAVVSPFVLGIIKPKIYLPFDMSEQDKELVIAHEQAHIHRKDHLWKPLGFLLLSLHWFNPLMWLGYILLCRDIEIACDERVAKKLSGEQRADYSQALLTCSVNRRMIAACPLAFGEVGVKDRVKNILNYKKPAFWLIVVAIIALVITSVCLLTDPASNKLKNIEFLSLDSRADETVGVWLSNGEAYRPVESFGKDELKELLNLKISDNEISLVRGEDRDTSHTIILQSQHNVEATAQLNNGGIDGLYINFDFDFTSVWVWDEVKPTLSYRVKEPEKARAIFNSFRESSLANAVITDSNLKILSTGSDASDVSIDVISLTESDLGDISLKIRWNNNSQETISYGKPFKLAEYESGEWFELKEKGYWNLPAYPVLPQSTEDSRLKEANREFEYNISDYYNIEESGKYRFSTEFFFESNKTKDYSVWVEFEIDNQTKSSDTDNISADEYIESVNNLYQFKSDNDTAGLSLSATDNKGSFSYSLFSSYMAYGAYEDDGKYIVLKTDDGQNIYTFKKTKDGLKFVAKKSSTLPSYRYSSGAKPEICLPDGAIFKKVQPEFVNTIDTVVFDIDKGGRG